MRTIVIHAMYSHYNAMLYSSYSGTPSDDPRPNGTHTYPNGITYAYLRITVASHVLVDGLDNVAGEVGA